MIGLAGTETGLAPSRIGMASEVEGDEDVSMSRKARKAFVLLGLAEFAY